jgi:hypothetical protein
MLTDDLSSFVFIFRSRRDASGDVGACDALLLCKVGDRLRAAALDPAPPAMRSNQRLDQGLWRTALRAACSIRVGMKTISAALAQDLAGGVMLLIMFGTAPALAVEGSDAGRHSADHASLRGGRRRVCA